MVSWWKIFNEDEFLALDLPSQSIDVVLDGGPGLKTILVTRGNYTGVLYEGIFLCLHLNDRNPFPFEGHALYLDEFGDVWLGIEDVD